jgi:hypothetical protein
LFTLTGAPAYRQPGRRQRLDKENPAFRRDFPALAWFTFELAILWHLLAGLLARILLLLAGLLTAALLLTGLLVRILVLLARSRVLVRHRRFSFVERSERQTAQPGIGFSHPPGSVVMIAW